ncbi:hypothetical protein DSECCO2_610370 [anaerobic digester metagenome]
MEQLAQFIRDLFLMVIEFFKGIVYLVFNIKDIIDSPAVVIFVILIFAIVPRKLFK